MDFRQGLPTEWTVSNGELGTQVVEISEGLSFPAQPPNLPKGSIRSSRFRVIPGALLRFVVSTKGSGLGGGWVTWYDAAGQTISVQPFAQSPALSFTEQVDEFAPPSGAASADVQFGVDTFGCRTIAQISVSSGPGN